MARKNILEVKDLKKKFKRFSAVDGISFNVEKGQIVGLLGPNGAGKTTTFQMLLGVTTPSGGSIKYFNKPFAENRVEILSRVNHMTGYGQFPARLTVYENMLIHSYLYSVKNRREKINELLKTFDIEKLASKQIMKLSAGQKTRVMLAKSLMNDPEMLLLDEPTASLDPEIADKTRKYILKARDERGLSVLITSHNMKEIEEVCDQVIFLNKGKVLAVDTPFGLAQRSSVSKLNLMVRDGLKRMISLIESRGYTFKESKRFLTVSMPEKDIPTLLREIGELGVIYDEIEILKPALEDFFLSVAKGGGNNDID